MAPRAHRFPAMLAAILGLATLLAAAPAWTSSGPGTWELQAQTSPTVVFLVRHAERAEDGTDDPPISATGHERARLLAEMLRDAELTHVHTTDLRRTRETGGPTAQSAGLAMQVYDPDDLDAFATELRGMPGRHLVLGHSNTTPALVEALGGDPGGAIDELEYDRLYVVTLLPDGASTVLIRFGEMYGGAG